MELTQIEVLTEKNSNFFLTTTRGEYVLTIFEKLTAGQLPFYLDLMRHLAAHGVPVPDPIPRDDGALFGDRRYERVFTYHNGVQSYYAARGFRGVLKV